MNKYLVLYYACMGLGGLFFAAMISSAFRDDLRSFVFWSLMLFVAMGLFPWMIRIRKESKKNDVLRETPRKP